jgi:hypothetical protein
MPRIALWLRLAVALAFIVTLSEPLLTSGGGTTNTVFLLDCLTARKAWSRGPPTPSMAG